MWIGLWRFHDCSLHFLLQPTLLGITFLGGDPAAGSPTATLLRLFPPYETWIRRSQTRPRLTQKSLGWNDGRCVQGAGTYSPHDSDARLLGIPCSRGWVTTLDPNYGRFSGLPPPFEVGTHCACHCSSRVAREIRGILTCRGPLLPPLYQRQSPQCAQLKASSNGGCGSRSLPDLTGHLTARTGDGHAPPLSSSGKTFNLAFILLSPPVRFPALTPIKPQASRLVVLPRQFL
jgi:hypothetical protein